MREVGKYEYLLCESRRNLQLQDNVSLNHNSLVNTTNPDSIFPQNSSTLPIARFPTNNFLAEDSCSLFVRDV